MVQETTLSDYCLSRTGLAKLKSWEKDAILVILGSLFLALMAQVNFALPYTVVPITMQSFAVLLIGSVFGARRAFLTTSLYLLEGIVGLPVFAGFGFGFAKIIGPTGGYLIGFVIAATTMGWLAERGWEKSFGKSLILFTLGHGLIFAFGLLGLLRFFPAEQVLALGLIPFIPGMIVKTLLAFPITPKLWKKISQL